MEDTATCSSNNETTKPDVQSSTFSDDNVSAPSSPRRELPYSYAGGFFYSAPTSPIHRLSSFSVSPTPPLEDAGGSFEFELTGEPAPLESMTSADELFFNGQIRPMKLSSHLQRPQDLAPLIDVSEINDGDEEDRTVGRGRAFVSRDRRRKARSMSPLRSNTAFQWLEEFNEDDVIENENEVKEKPENEHKHKQRDDDVIENETTSSGASSRSSSLGRSSKRWVFLKDFLYRSKSEGRNNRNRNRNPRFWSTLPFTPSSKKSADSSTCNTAGADENTTTVKKAVNGVGVNRKRRVGRTASAHEVHYTRNRAQMEEMRKKTYLPYRQGLLGCLGFSSKSYGAINGFARALNPVSSR